jgi:hypothetical protein
MGQPQMGQYDQMGQKPMGQYDQQMDPRQSMLPQYSPGMAKQPIVSQNQWEPERGASPQPISPVGTGTMMSQGQDPRYASYGSDGLQPVHPQTQHMGHPEAAELYSPRN